MSSYKELTYKKLRQLARARGIKYISQMNKPELIETLEKNDSDPSFIINPIAKDRCFAHYDKWRKNPDNREKYLTYHRSYNHRVRAAEAKCTQRATFNALLLISSNE